MATGLKNGESIYIDSGREIIQTDIINTYRYDNIVGDFDYLTLKKGNYRELSLKIKRGLLHLGATHKI